MICEKCGTKLSDDAEFCANCGRKVTPKQARSDAQQESKEIASNTSNERATAEKSKNSHKKLKVGLIVLLAVVILGTVGFVCTTKKSKDTNTLEDIKPEWYDKNSGKGADDPETIARTVMMALRNDSPELLDIYQDEQFLYEDSYFYKNKFVTYYNDIIDLGIDPKRIYLEGITYETRDEYEGNGKINVEVETVYYEEGVLGGEPIFKGETLFTLIGCHQNETPEGVKWFWGAYDPDYRYDPTGLGM